MFLHTSCLCVNKLFCRPGAAAGKSGCDKNTFLPILLARSNVQARGSNKGNTLYKDYKIYTITRAQPRIRISACLERGRSSSRLWEGLRVLGPDLGRRMTQGDPLVVVVEYML